MPVTRTEFFEGLDRQAYAVLMNAEKEYASCSDSLENFHTVATMLSLPSRTVACVYLMKHVNSICKGVSLREGMRGRIVDAMNYLRLIAYMLYIEEGE